jgi:hypothetical protein
MKTKEVEDFMTEYKPSEDKDRTVPYFEQYEVDSFARDRMLEPIEFDWSRICELDAIEEDRAWYVTPFYRMCVKKGLKHKRFLVNCATHGYFRQIVMEPPTEKIGYKCQRCITAEIDRIVNLRTLRDMEFRRRAREEQR